MKLEIGKFYRDGKGAIREIVKRDGAYYPFRSRCNQSYTKDGMYNNRLPSKNDLEKEVHVIIETDSQIEALTQQMEIAIKMREEGAKEERDRIIGIIKSVDFIFLLNDHDMGLLNGSDHIDEFINSIIQQIKK